MNLKAVKKIFQFVFVQYDLYIYECALLFKRLRSVISFWLSIYSESMLLIDQKLQ